jgi:hypothetical protein
MKSLSVNPPILCVQMSTTSRPHETCRLHRLRKVVEAIRAGQHLHRSVFGVAPLDDAPAGAELGEQRTDLLVRERRRVAAARNALTLRKLTHGYSFQGRIADCMLDGWDFPQ